jgi:hypothetical protein
VIEYNGSIEFLKGGEVLATYPCTCGRCCYWSPSRVYGRREARVVDPLTGTVHYIYHARPESLGMAPFPTAAATTT